MALRWNYSEAEVALVMLDVFPREADPKPIPDIASNFVVKELRINWVSCADELEVTISYAEDQDSTPGVVESQYVGCDICPLSLIAPACWWDVLLVVPEFVLTKESVPDIWGTRRDTLKHYIQNPA